MDDVAVGKVPLGAAKPPSRRDGVIGPSGLHFNRMGGLTETRGQRREGRDGWAEVGGQRRADRGEEATRRR